jgi:hypothetical protein
MLGVDPPETNSVRTIDRGAIAILVNRNQPSPVDVLRHFEAPAFLRPRFLTTSAQGHFQIAGLVDHLVGQHLH